MILVVFSGEQPVYANLKDLNIQVQGQETDIDKTPTAREPPSTDMSNGQEPKVGFVSPCCDVRKKAVQGV